MRRIPSPIIAFIILMLCCSELIGQNYNTTPDIIYGQRCYKETDGVYVGHGDKNGTGAIAWPSNNNTQLVYYLHIPVGNIKMYAHITPKTTCALRLKVTDPETSSIIYETEEGATGKQSTKIEIIPNLYFKQDKWYRFEFSASTGYSSIASLNKLEFYRESNLAVTTAGIFMAPSTHLWTRPSVEPEAPSGQSYDWAYEEVMFPSKYEHPARYVEAIGVLKGYMGIQYTGTGNRNVIFSMWDNGDTDKDPNLPEYLRSGLMDKDPRVTSERFAGEGTGMKTIFENGQFYRPDRWVQFLFNARPEIVDVTLTGNNGQDSVIKYQNTITTAWYKMEDDPDWTYISTIRASGAANYFNSFYSFLENFGDTGSDFTRAYYRNAYMRSLASGKWYNINHFTFSNTQNTGARNSRSDFGRGVTEIYPNAFYMEHGGFTTTVNDSSQYAGIPLDRSCVDTIDIDSKIERINLAIKRNNLEQTKTRLHATGEKYDLTKWKVIGYSDQEEEAVANNGHASMAVDGNEKTYWQNKWKSGGVTYPHWIALKAPKPVTISQIDLYSAKTSYLFWPKSVVVHTSTDGINWTAATDTAIIAKKAKSSTKLSKRITSQYFKIEFVEPYGAMMYINELSLSTDISTSKIIDYASTLLENANRFDSYQSEVLEPLEKIYSNGQGDPDSIANCITKIAADATPLKYGTIKYNEHISSLKYYQLCNSSGYGKLIISEGKPTIGEATINTALTDYAKKVDVTQEANNWMIIRCEGEGYTYLYSPTANKYLDLSSETMLSDTPSQITLRYSYPNYDFTIFNNGKYLSLDPESADSPIKGLNTPNKSCHFMIYDNFFLTPKQAFASSKLDSCKDYAKFDNYKKKARNLLAVPEGQVGCPDIESKAILQDVYDDGNVTIENRHKLYNAVDSCKRIPFNPNKYCYRLKAPNGNYLTATPSPNIANIAEDKNNTSQIWSLRQKSEGLALSAQSTVIGRIPSYTSRILPITSLTNMRDIGTCYLTEEEPGVFIISTNQHGGIAISSKNVGKTANYNVSEASFYLEIADKINVELNSAGLLGVNYNFNIVVPEEQSVYIVSRVDNGIAYLQKVSNCVQAGTPVIIKGNANENVVLNIKAPTNADIANNALKGTLYEDTLHAGQIYTLSPEKGGLFAKAKSGTVPQNSVYLNLQDPENTAEAITLCYHDDQTAVNSTTNVITRENSKCFDFQGRPATRNQKGLIIENSKKTINK